MKLFIVIILLFTITLQSIKHIQFDEIRKIEIQLGQHFQSMIPQFFEIYQSSELKSTQNTSQKFNQNLCRIQIIQQSKYTAQNIFYHIGLSDPQSYYNGNKKVYNFQDLKKLNGVLDTAIFDNQIVVLFNTRFYAFYNINLKNGNVTLIYQKQISIQQKDKNQQNKTDIFNSLNYLNYGHFIEDQSGNYLIFFSQDKIYLMEKNNKQFQLVTGYTQIGMQLEKAVIKGNKIYVAASQRGILIYQIDFINKKINLKQQFQIYIKQNSNQNILDIQDLYINQLQKYIVIIDQIQGIYWVKMPSNQNISKVQCQPKGILLQNCQNMKFLKNENKLIATCPSFIIIDLSTKKFKTIQQINFYVQTLTVNQSRIYLFGQYQYAIYDIDSSLVQTGFNNYPVRFVNVYENWIITVNRYGIMTGLIQATKEQIQCKANGYAQQYVGINKGFLEIQGICSQLFNSPVSQNNQDNLFLFTKEEAQKISNAKNLEENCQIIIPVQIELKDSSVISYVIQFIIIGFILWGACGFVIYLCVKDIKLRKQYQNLGQQPSGVNDKGHSQMVLSEKSTKVNSNM